jgi:hypothetical protein
MIDGAPGKEKDARKKAIRCRECERMEGLLAPAYDMEEKVCINFNACSFRNTEIQRKLCARALIYVVIEVVLETIYSFLSLHV